MNAFSIGSFQRSRGDRSGFTLIEMLVVITIILLLAGIILNVAGWANNKAARERAAVEIVSISAAMESYKADFGDYPSSLLTLTTPQTDPNAPTAPMKVYLEFKTKKSDGTPLDPWGSSYSYAKTGTRNVGSFDLWTTAGGKPTEPQWVKNW